MSDPVSRLNAALSGRYRVERQLGEGGMATVYLAEDVRHRRKVALKVLKPELAAVVGAERFLAEIETTANLQHPHILPLFDSGEADTFLFYVMPYVEGESLRERLDRERQLPVDEAVRMATNVAEALDYAHRHGVIHRDIKPANILLLDGKPVVADFGIAFAVSHAGSSRLTETGLSLGTPHYMSPEQATGDAQVGPGADIWALGCVLYEMLVGEPPHMGSTPQAVLGKIITAEAPSAREARKSIPPNVDAAIRKTLEKVPADRFKSGLEVARALGDARFSHRENEVVVASHPAHLGWKRIAAAALVVSVLSIGWATWTTAAARGRVANGAGRHLNISLPDSLPVMLVGEHWSGNGEVSIALSPDGQDLLYVGPEAATTRLYLRQLGDPAIRALEGTEGAYSPAFSPDGQTIAFFAGGRMLRVSIDGGPVQVVAEAALTQGPPAWAEDGRIAIATSDSRALRIVSPGGGSTEIVATSPPSPFMRDPHWIAGTEWILITCGQDPQQLCALSPTGEFVWLARGGLPEVTPASDRALVGSHPWFVEPGYLIYSAPARAALMGVRLDPTNLAIDGEPSVLVEGVRREAWGAIQATLSESGDLAFIRGPNAGLSRLVWARRDGTVDTLAFPARDYGRFSLSPDNRRVAIRIYPDVDEPQLWFFDLERGPPGTQWVGATRERATGALLSNPQWLPGSVRAVTMQGDSSIVEIDALSPRGATALRSGTGLGIPVDVGADGRIVFVESPGVEEARATLMTRADVTELNERRAEGATTISVPGLGTFTDLSPQGDWLAYHTFAGGVREGPYEVHAVRVDGTFGPVRVSAGPGETPRWSPRGDGLFYREGRRFYWVPFTGAATDPFGEPELVFTGSFKNAPGSEMEVSAAGSALLLLQAEGAPQATSLDFIENFRARLIEQLGPVN